jgi:2-hydroxy-6-oxonona-2,4-dienedioate hydrolase
MTTSTMFRNAESRSVMDRAYARLLDQTPQAQSRSVKTRFGDTHMLVAGPEDAPPLVVLHGAMANSAVALREGGPFLDRFRLHLVDVIGQSVKSADVRLRVDNADYAEWVKDVLDELGLTKAHVYGASYGGFIARKLAEIAPERIDRLVLLVPAGIVNGPLLTGIARAGIPLFLYKTMGSKSALEKLLGSMLSNRDDALFEYLGQAFTHYKLDLKVPPVGSPEPLAAFRRPTLVLAAADDIHFPANALMTRARELFPHAEVELLAESKHIPPTDDASRTRLCGRISRFLLADSA